MNSFDVVVDFVRSTQTLNKDLFEYLIDDDCEIEYKFDGIESGTINKEEYVSRLVKGHFNNTIYVDVKKLTIEKDVYDGNEIFVVEEIANFTRRGSGKNEDGPGIYRMESTGILRLNNNKIIYMSYEFNKNKLDE